MGTEVKGLQNHIDPGISPLHSHGIQQFDLTMKLKWEELRKQERNSTQVNEITEGDLIQAFGVTEDQMEKAAAMLGRSEKTEKWGNLSA